VLNAEERTREPGRIPIKFGRSERGDFDLVRLSSSERVLLPRAGKALNQGRYEGGGWTEFFECEGVDPGFRKQSSYNYRVVRPAKIAISGESVQIIEKGVLEIVKDKD
jgi:hypothetical protein